MAIEDKLLRLRIMRELTRRQIVTVYLNVSCHKGVVRLSGRLVLVSRGRRREDVQDEMRKIIEIIRRMEGVRDVIDETGTLEPEVVRRGW